MGDITRYAHDRHKAWQMQFLLPVMITLTELLGTVMAASAQVIYGSVEWNPLLVVLQFDNRAGKFFCGFFFAFANIATNVAGNSVPFANDLSGMFPKYVNIRRGQIICAILGWVICPWLIQAKAQRFLAFLNGYTVFLGPVIGILLSDYWIVRRAKGFSVWNLYQPGGLYWYTGGINPRAIGALLMGMAPLLPGLIHNINPNLSVGRGIQEFYTLSWLDGLVLSGLSYYLLFLAFPFKTMSENDAEENRVVEGQVTQHPQEEGSSTEDYGEKTAQPREAYV